MESFQDRDTLFPLPFYSHFLFSRHMWVHSKSVHLAVRCVAVTCHRSVVAAEFSSVRLQPGRQT